MGELQLISQLTSGELVLAIKGEYLVDHYTFYAVFKTPEEYRVMHQGKSLGTLPVDAMALANEHIVFAGSRWKINDVDIDKKLIIVNPTKGGSPPNFVGGSGIPVHDRVRQEMYKIYQKGDYKIDLGESKIDFLDSTARDLFFEGLEYFRNAKLQYSFVIAHGEYIYIIPWVGDKIINTLIMLLLRENIKSSNYGGVIEIVGMDEYAIFSTFKTMAKQSLPTESELALLVKDKIVEKYDHLLPESLLLNGYGAGAFDISGAQEWLLNTLFE